MYKRIYFLLAVLGVSVTVMAQDESDALRYSQLTSGGSARVQAIGGAMGSLGGDYTATHVNPAGLGLYKTNEWVLTPGFFSLKNNASYRGNRESNRKSNLYFGNAGLVVAMNQRGNDQQKAWKNITLGLGINRLANFNSNLYLKGNNNQSSFAEKYIEELTKNGIVDPNLAAKNYPFGSSLAINTYLLDPTYNSNNQVTGYSSVVFNTTGVIQENAITTSGALNELSLGAAGNYSDKFYIGASLNVPSLRYRRTNTYTETDQKNDPTNKFQSFTLKENLTTEGNGINAKLGMIFKPTEFVRVGAAFHTPTAYSLKDTYDAEMTTNTEAYQGIKRQSSYDLTNGYPGEYQYTLITPWRAVVSASYVLREIADVTKQKGFLTFDYEYVNYAAASFRFDNSNAGDKALADKLNRSISKMYKGASNIRIGGELKFNTIMARAGFAWYGSPYQNSNTKGDKKLISAGLGYRNHGMFVDLTYVYALGKDLYYPYRLQDKNVSPATIDRRGGNVVLSIGLKF